MFGITNKYDDIINMPHHVSKKHKPMSLEARSAQFAPFAALTGYGDAVIETARQTSAKIEINEELEDMLNEKFKLLKCKMHENPKVEITYFIKDKRKEGGKYVKEAGIVKKINEYEQKIILENNVNSLIEIYIPEIIEIEINENCRN